jgi:hypothetical protein
MNRGHELRGVGIIGSKVGIAHVYHSYAMFNKVFTCNANKFLNIVCKLTD